MSSPACYLHELDARTPDAGRREVAIKRIYDAAEPADGFRALIDRLWPRGMSRRRAALDAWLVELAPTTALRKWFDHDPKRWREFGRRYRAELRGQRAALEALGLRAAAERLTLLTATREPRLNHAAVLRAVLLRSARSRRRAPPP